MPLLRPVDHFFLTMLKATSSYLTRDLLQDQQQRPRKESTHTRLGGILMKSDVRRAGGEGDALHVRVALDGRQVVLGRNGGVSMNYIRIAQQESL